jgi:hypothetical protein
VRSFFRIAIGCLSSWLLISSGSNPINAVEIPRPVIVIPKPNIPRPTINVPRPNVAVNVPKPAPKIDVPKPHIVTVPSVVVTRRTVDVPRTSSPKLIVNTPEAKSTNIGSSFNPNATIKASKPKDPDLAVKDGPLIPQSVSPKDPSLRTSSKEAIKAQSTATEKTKASSNVGGFVDCKVGNPACNVDPNTYPAQTTQFPKLNTPAQSQGLSSGPNGTQPAGSPNNGGSAPLAVTTGGTGPNQCKTCVPGNVYSLADTPGTYKFLGAPGCGAAGAPSCWQQVSATTTPVAAITPAPGIDAGQAGSGLNQPVVPPSRQPPIQTSPVQSLQPNKNPQPAENFKKDFASLSQYAAYADSLPPDQRRIFYNETTGILEPLLAKDKGLLPKEGNLFQLESEITKRKIGDGVNNNSSGSGFEGIGTTPAPTIQPLR